jgi:PST family polysaccharide transporter
MAKSVGVYFEDHRESRELGRVVLRDGVLSVAMQYGNGLVQIVAAIVLARLLAPEDFGLFAIVTVVTSFAPLLIDFGLGDATTQKNKITQTQVSTLFWLSSAIGLGIATVVAASGPLIAWIYREPRLEAIVLYSAITFVLFGISNQHLALLRQTMQFARIAKIQILSSLLGVGIAIVMAICGYGYWALVSVQLQVRYASLWQRGSRAHGDPACQFSTVK